MIVGAAKTMKILLVEDDKGHATLVQMNLREGGLNNAIDHVINGQQALDYVNYYVKSNESSSLLILLDLNLPGVDGYEVLKILKANEKTRQIPIIVLTSTDDNDEIEQCYALGCNVYLRKPVDYDEFIESIKTLGLFLSFINLPGNSHNYT